MLFRSLPVYGGIDESDVRIDGDGLRVGIEEDLDLLAVDRGRAGRARADHEDVESVLAPRALPDVAVPVHARAPGRDVPGERSELLVERVSVLLVGAELKHRAPSCVGLGVAGRQRAGDRSAIDSGIRETRGEVLLQPLEALLVQRTAGGLSISCVSWLEGAIRVCERVGLGLEYIDRKSTRLNSSHL